MPQERLWKWQRYINGKVDSNKQGSDVDCKRDKYYVFSNCALLLARGQSLENIYIELHSCIISATQLGAPQLAAILTSAANRLIGEVVQSRRRPLLGPSPG